MVNRLHANAEWEEMVKNLSNETLEAPKFPSIDPAEVEKFSQMASEWWDPKGKFRPLHKFNPTRLRFIRETLTEHFALDRTAVKPFEGLRILDIGCGGGLVSEPMARLGASMTGVDASERNIKTASVHAQESGLDIDYRAGAVEGLVAAGEAPFDVVPNLEVVEHVADPAAFLEATAGLVKPGGLMIVATINRTRKAQLLAIIGAERVLRWLPPGTHDYDKLVKPDEVIAAMNRAGMSPRDPVGVSYNPLLDSWRTSRDTDVNYMVVGERA